MLFFTAALLFLVGFKLLRTGLLKLVGVCSTVTSTDSLDKPEVPILVQADISTCLR